MANLINTSHTGYVKDVQFNHDGQRLATCSADSRPRIEVYDKDTAGQWTIRHLPWSAHEQTINKLCWAHPRFGQIIASCSDDTSVEIWEELDAISGSQPKWHKRATLSDARKPIKDVAFCPCHLGLKLACAGMDGRVYVYEAQDIMNLSDWVLEDFFDPFEIAETSSSSNSDKNKTRNAGVRCLSWNPSKFDAPMLVVGSEGNDDGSAMVRVWQYGEAVRKWEMVCDLDKHYRQDSGCQVNDVAWAPNMGRSYHLIASAGQDHHQQLKIHRLLRTPQGVVSAGPAEVLDADQPQGIWRVEWNVTGTVLASSGEEGVVRLWKSTFRGDWKEIKIMPTEKPSN